MREEVLNIKILNKLLKDHGVIVFDDGHCITAKDVKDRISKAASYKILVHSVQKEIRGEVDAKLLKSLSATVYIYDQQGREIHSFLIDSHFEMLQKNIENFYKVLNMSVMALDVYNLQVVSKFEGKGSRSGLFFYGAYITKINKDGKVIWQLTLSDKENDIKEFNTLNELLNYAEQLAVSIEGVVNP